MAFVDNLDVQKQHQAMTACSSVFILLNVYHLYDITMNWPCFGQEVVFSVKARHSLRFEDLHKVQVLQVFLFQFLFPPKNLAHFQKICPLKNELAQELSSHDETGARDRVLMDV